MTGRRRPWLKPGQFHLRALAVLLCGIAVAEVTFTDAWIRMARPGSSVTAGYFIASNTGRARVLIGFEAKGRVEMHETMTENGVSRMRPLARVAIGLGDVVAFEPGGMHLMLFGLDAAASAVVLTAVFEDGNRQEVTFEVGQP